MLSQVIICTVSDSPQLTPSEWEKELNVCSSLTVEGKLFLIMVTVTYFLIFQSVQAEALPVIKPLKVCVRFAEELKLHLLELSCTECKVTRCDLVSERFSDLSDTKRKFLS